MPETTLPSFRYHPDPLATGSVVVSPDECVCCGIARGYIYTGPVYAVEEYDNCICPWCIADGSAHEKLGASFCDDLGIGAGGLWGRPSQSVVETVAHRTPGFCGWQQEQWWVCCDDAAQYLGRVGKKELIEIGDQAVAAIQNSTGLPDGAEWDRFFEALDKDGSPTAYLFQCIHCSQYGGYQDCE